ncbi:centrosomal protein of 44 kDa isoform X2 [Ambystoma mexicanum]|uniref:centrosomal protein of 44 kDa isoform X2 n=1 Tax=Ambystoma mexicanum TaxID=8296 RepID=UPI0037E8E588
MCSALRAASYELEDVRTLQREFQKAAAYTERVTSCGHYDRIRDPPFNPHAKIAKRLVRLLHAQRTKIGRLYLSFSQKTIRKMATGDMKGCLRKLEQALRLLNYPRDVNYSGLINGDPAASLPIISYTFTSYSTHIAEILVSSDIELTAKSDLRFIDAVYKVLRDQFNYKPVLTKQQFLQCGFAERKIHIVCDIINFVLKKHKELTNLSKVKSKPKRKPGFNKNYIEDQHKQLSIESDSVQPTWTSMKPFVQRHMGSEVDVETPNTLILNHEEESWSAEEDIVEVNCEKEISEDLTQMKMLQIQLLECQEKLQKLNWMEEKLFTLEEKMKGKIIIDEKDWDNLLSRVLLVETELLLRTRKNDLSAEFDSMSEERTSSRLMNPISPDNGTKGETPESFNHQSSGYSSLLSADASPKAVAINCARLTAVSKTTNRQRMERINKMIEETSDLLKYSAHPS